MHLFIKKMVNLIMVCMLVFSMMPTMMTNASAEETDISSFEGKTISILGDSISTFSGVSNNTSYNSTIGSNSVYYSSGTLGVSCSDTWWQQTIDLLGMELLVNNSWSGSTVYPPRYGESSVGYGDRCVNLHNDKTGQEPDVIVVFLGTNDFSYYQDTLGTVDFDFNSLISEGTYIQPQTTCEAYAIMLSKMISRYPDAEIYCMSLTARRSPDKVDSYADVGQPTEFNAELKKIIEHYGAHYVDLEHCGIDADAEVFDFYMGDGRVHPNKEGMDKITEALISTMLTNETSIRNVNYSFNGIKCDTAISSVLDNDCFSAELTCLSPYTDMDVTVTMGGLDVTNSVYCDGVICVSEVSGDITINATGTLNKDKEYFRWEFDGSSLLSKGESENDLTKQTGTITDGVLNSVRYDLAKPVLLRHDAKWSVEWKCSGDWSGMLLSSHAQSATEGMSFLFRTYNATGLIAIGEYSGQYNNYGIAMANLDLDMSVSHTYRLENRIFDDGSNMAYLSIDGTEIGAMNHYYVGGTNNQNMNVNWISGKDFVFDSLGSTSHPLKMQSLEYLEINEDQIHTHIYENGVCTVCGDVVSPYLQQLPEDFMGCTDLYDHLTAQKGYYTASKYDTSNGEVLSVVIPVEPGDRIAASSFASVSENMGTVNGIRVTYLLKDEIALSVAPNDVYNAYIAEGFITVPEGVDAVCVPWWKPSEDNWLTLSQKSKDFAAHRPVEVLQTAPTCTESGFSVGEICEICQMSLSGRIEIEALGHDFSGLFCTVCGAADLQSILQGKHVSILGDSISTFNGYSNDASINTTIGVNAYRYDVGETEGKPGSFCLLESVSNTWWMDIANRTGMNLLVNNSWAGAQVFGGMTSDGRIIPAAYLDRCVQLHDDTLENNPNTVEIQPDVIFVYMGINDYNFNRSAVGEGEVDYAGLIKSDGSYAEPEHFGEAYGIMLHKMKTAYPDAHIFVMTLLPENLYSIDMDAWRKHNDYIRSAAEAYGVHVIDLAEDCAITWDNYSSYMMDKIHPTSSGMKLIAECVESELQDYYQDNPPCTELIITQQPEDGEAKKGDRYCVRVEAEGEGLTYQWYGKNANSKRWFKSSVTDNTYDDVMTDARAGREVYCVITDENGNSVTTDTVKLVMLPSEELMITRQPVDAEAVLGDRYEIVVEAQGEGLQYQWYFRNEESSKWKKSSVKDNTYDDVMTKARAGREVYCVIKDKFGNSVTSDIAKLVRIPAALEIVEQPADFSAAMGEQFCVEVEAKGEGLKYQWYYRNAGSLQWRTSGVRDNTYDDIMTKERANREVYCVITDQWGSSVTTEIAKLIPVSQVELILLDVTYEAADLGECYCVYIDAQGEDLSYTWYFRNAGSTRWSKSSVKDNTYDDIMNKNRMNREVYCVITDACGNQIITEIITLSVK